VTALWGSRSRSPDRRLLSRTVAARRLSIVSGVYAYLLARGDFSESGARGLPTRWKPISSRTGSAADAAAAADPHPAKVDALTVALRSHPDRAMVAAMVFGRLRRCESSACRWKTFVSLNGG
jgi:integrase/recombinase XerD